LNWRDKARIDPGKIETAGRLSTGNGFPVLMR
jgi:hypothetical protein